MKRFAALALAGAISLGLVACQSSEQAAAPVAEVAKTPADAISMAAADLKAGNLVGVLQRAVPKAQYDKLKAEWKDKTSKQPSSEAEEKEFSEFMAKFTAADAETKLFAEIEPQIAKAEAEMGAQLPLMIGMGRGFAAQAISESKDITDAQKTQATAMVDAIAKWVEGAKFFDRELAKQAVAKAVATARALEVTSLKQLEAMEFEQVMQKAGIVFNGTKDVLALYGLDLNAALDSVKAEVLNESGDQAKVKIGYTLFGQALSAETEMVKQGDRWFGKDALATLDKAMAEEPAATEATAEASSEEAPSEGAVAPEGNDSAAAPGDEG